MVLLLLTFVLLVYAFTEVTYNAVLLAESVPKSYEQIMNYVFGQKRDQVHILGESMYHAGLCDVEYIE